MKQEGLNSYINNNKIDNFYIYDNDNFKSFLNNIKFSFNVPFIHVSGTSGKSIISKVLYNIYSTKFNVGLFSLNEFNANDLLNKFYFLDNNLSNNIDIDEIFNKYVKQINKYKLTVYEVLLFICLYIFNESKLDLAIIDPYIGAYFDPSNVIGDPLMVILNDVGLEHSEDLGKSVSEITLSKCGLIKNNSKVLLNSLDEDINYVVTDYCKKTKSKLYKVSEFYKYDVINNKLNIAYYPFPNFIVNINGLFNRDNIASALECINILNDIYHIDNEDIQLGLNKDISICVFEEFNLGSSKLIIDSADNPYSIAKLSKTIDYQLGSNINNLLILFAVDLDKNVEKMLSLLSNITHNIVLTTYDDDNARDKEGFFLFEEDYNFVDDFKSFIDSLKDRGIYVLVVGNKIFAHQVREYITK